jgi:predicted transcriptional regulator
VADNLKELTASIIESYVEANKVAAADLGALIQATYAALSEASRPAERASQTVAKPTPAQIRKSITPDKLISFIDNRAYSLLKRHLTGHGLTPADYREKYGLPFDYPIVAANYAAKRSELARRMGLGQKPAAVSKPVAARTIAKPARTSPEAEKAGPGARVKKARRAPQGAKPS